MTKPLFILIVTDTIDSSGGGFVCGQGWNQAQAIDDWFDKELHDIGSDYHSDFQYEDWEADRAEREAFANATHSLLVEQFSDFEPNQNPVMPDRDNERQFTMQVLQIEVPLPC